MPIVVKHGEENGGAMALIAALAGMGQRPIPQMPQMHNLIGDLGGHGQGRITHSDIPSAYPGGMPLRYDMSPDEQLRFQQQAKQMQFGMELEQKKAEAKMEADQWQAKYTAKQRQEIASFNKARQDVMNNSRFSPQEKASAIRAIDLQQANIQPSLMPRDPNQPKFPDGQDIGQVWKDENGSVVTRDPDGKVRLVQRFDQSPEAAQLKVQAEQQKRVADLQVKQQMEVMKLRAKLASEDVQVGSGENATFRKRSQKEVDEIMQAAIGGGSQGQQQENAPWWRRPENEGMRATVRERRMPDEVGYAHAYLRNLKSKYGSFDKVPEEERDQARQASDLVRQYASLVQ